MDQRTTGLILRTRPLTETSLIVHWLTRDFGRLSTIAQGARRAKSPFLGKIDLYFVADFTFQRSRRGDLHLLRELTVRERHRALRLELAYLQQAAYFTQLIEQSTESDTPLPGLFELFTGALETLLLTTPRRESVFVFELKLLGELGLAPDLAQTSLTPGSQELLRGLLAESFSTAHGACAIPSQSNEIEFFLGRLWSSHLGKLPKGRTAALQSAVI